MTPSVAEIPQPGGTGNVGALWTLKAVRRASPVGPIGHRSMAASVRNVGSLCGSLTVRFSPPVSVGLRTIETGDTTWRNARTYGPLRESASVQKSTKPPRRRRIDLDPAPAPDPRPTQSRSSRGVMSSTVRIFGSACPAVGDDSRVVERYRPSAAGASSGLTLNTSGSTRTGVTGPAAKQRKDWQSSDGGTHEENQSAGHQV